MAGGTALAHARTSGRIRSRSRGHVVPAELQLAYRWRAKSGTWSLLSEWPRNDTSKGKRSRRVLEGEGFTTRGRVESSRIL